MQETAQRYITRIRSYLANQEPLDVLAETPAQLRALVEGVPDSQLRTRPAPEKWSIMEQVAHLSDVEIVVGYRVRCVLGAADGVPIAAFDQDNWQRAFRYNDLELEPTLRAFSAARENNLRLYRSLDEVAWNKFGMHSERGKESVRDIVTLSAGHDLNHMMQIGNIAEQSAG